MSGRHAAPRATWARVRLHQLSSFLAGWRASGDLTDEDKGTVLWVDGIKVPDLEPAIEPEGPVHGPAAPARRPQLATVARVRAAAIIRAIPLDAIPWLREGQYEDPTGTFTAIAATPPVLHADESVSLTRAALTAGLARHVEDWTP